MIEVLRIFAYSQPLAGMFISVVIALTVIYIVHRLSRTADDHEERERIKERLWQLESQARNAPPQ